MLVTSQIPTKIRSTYYKLEKLLYWQNLGNKQNFAIFCSIVHSFLNQKNYRPLQKFLNVNEKNLTEDSQQIQQLITQSLEDQNPIQQFFRNLSQQQKYIEKIEKLLDELCRIHFLMKNQKPSLDSIGLFLQIEINFLHNNEKYGRGLQQLLLLKCDNEFYFIIPHHQIKQLPKYQCYLCSSQVQYFIKLNCKHILCLTCIQTLKQNSKDNYFLCRCGQIVLKNEFLEDAIKGTQDNQILNDSHSCIVQFYEMDTKGDPRKKESKYEDAMSLKQQPNQYHPPEIKKFDSKTMDSSNKYQRQVPERNQKKYDNMGYPYQKQLIPDLDYNDYYHGSLVRQQYYCVNYQNRTYQPQPNQSKDHFQEGNSFSFDLMSKTEEMRSQQFYEQSQKFQNQICSYCLSPFDEFNVIQDIGCSKHVIGACCISRNFEKCPQCEKVKEIQNRRVGNMKFKPEKINIHNQPTNYFGNQNYQYRKQPMSASMVSNSNRLEPTMNSVYGNSFQERQIQMQPCNKIYQPYEYH